ncbi:MAG: hypothetical protein AAF693_11330 [Bacteroidota bacterium]
MRIFSIYYALYLLLIIGVFASMAQNSYGLDLVGMAALGFGVLFLWQGVNTLFFRHKRKILVALEFLGMSIMAAIFAMRAYFIHIEGVEIIFSLATGLLVFIFLSKALTVFRSGGKDAKLFLLFIALYYSCIVLFLLSMSLAPFSPFISEVIGGLSFFLLAFFVVLGFLKSGFIYRGEKIQPLLYVSRIKDTSVILVITLVLFSLYVGLTKINLVPSLYSSELPQGYIELINDAESGKGTDQNGELKHKRYKKRYDEFMEKNIK